MKTFLLLLLSMVLLSGTAMAQKISGHIQQPGGAPAEFATVLLYSAADTALVKGSVADTDGKYEFENIPSGQFFINTNLIGAGKGVAPVFEYKGGDKVLEPIVLQENVQELGTVTVVARKPVIEVQADKTILNVEDNINSQGQNALELLRKAPGVVVDNNENISLRGKNSVRFQIDGRDVRMDGKDLADILKGMRAEDIAAIEMITNPSAKFDASGNAGIINIKTRKMRAYGTNGSFGGEAVYGESLKGGGNLSFNHRNARMNVFGNYGNHFGDWHNDIFLYREQAGKIFDQTSYMKDNNNNHNFKIGSDIFLNSKNTLGFVVDGRHAQGPGRIRRAPAFIPSTIPPNSTRFWSPRTGCPKTATISTSTSITGLPIPVVMNSPWMPTAGFIPTAPIRTSPIFTKTPPARMSFRKKFTGTSRLRILTSGCSKPITSNACSRANSEWASN